MTITTNIHNLKRAAHNRLKDSKNDSLDFETADGRATLFVPPHVAAHTAAAFNRAMQAVPDRSGGWTYEGKSGVWNITCEMPELYRAQHEAVTGDNDPYWYFVAAKTLIGCLDAIDNEEAESGCTDCGLLVGCEATTEIDDEFLCNDCLREYDERQRGMREMALDDMAHAERDRRAGL